MWRTCASARLHFHRLVRRKRHMCSLHHSPLVSSENLIGSPRSRSRIFPKITPLNRSTRSLAHQSMNSSEFEPHETGEFSEYSDGIFENEAGDSLNEPEADEINFDGQTMRMDDFAAQQLGGGAGDEGVDEVRREIDPAKLEVVLSLLQSSPDGSFESTLDKMGLDLSQEFLLRVFETPLLLSDNVLRFFKWAMKNPEFKVTGRVVHALVQQVCSDHRTKDAYALWDLVKEVGTKEKGVLDVPTLNTLMAHFSWLGKGKAALEVLDKFDEFGCVPSEDSFYFAIEALCRRSMYDLALPVSERMLNAGRLPDSEKVVKIISWFCKGRKAEFAHLIYMTAKESKSLPQSCTNFLVDAMSQDDQTVKLAREMLDSFTGEVRKYAIRPFSAVVRGLCRSGDIDGAKELLYKMIADGPPPGNAVFNLIICKYSKAGELELAKELTRLMETRGLKPDVYTYTVIISGYANAGQMDQALGILSEAKKKHTKLSHATYHTLVRGYCKLEEFDKALELMNEMEDFGVQPNVDEYNKMIQSLCLKALDWQTAEKLLAQMKEKGLHLNGITRGLIRAVKELEGEALEAGDLMSTA